MNQENVLIMMRPTARRYLVTTAKGKWQWAGSAREIVAQMSALEFNPVGSLLAYMVRVKKRIKMTMEIDIIVEPGKYLRFLRALEYNGLIHIMTK